MLVLALRRHYVRRLLPNVELLAVGARGAIPVAVAAALVGVARLAWSGPRTGGEAIFELVLFLVATALVTWLAERSLVRELMQQIRAGGLRQGIAPAAATTGR